MNLPEGFWREIDRAPVPKKKEIEALKILEMEGASVFYEGNQISDEYLKIQVLYKALFSIFLSAKSGIERLDDRLAQRHFIPASGADMDFYQRYDLLGLDYLYLRSYVHVERLNEEQVNVFARCIDQKDDGEMLREAAKVMEATYKDVLAVKPNLPEQYFEIFPSLHGEGRIKGRAVLIGMKSKADYDEQERLKDEEAEKKRIRIFKSVKKQLEEILSRTLETEVVVVAEV